MPVLDKHPALKAASTFTHTDVSIKMDEKPSQALRLGRLQILDVARHPGRA